MTDLVYDAATDEIDRIMEDLSDAGATAIAKAVAAERKRCLKELRLLFDAQERVAIQMDGLVAPLTYEDVAKAIEERGDD